LPDKNAAPARPSAEARETEEHESLTRVLITRSAGGLGRATAEELLDQGHKVVIHARNAERLAETDDLTGRGADSVVDGLSSAEQTYAVADQVNQLRQMDAVIHNAAVYTGQDILAVNVVAPYIPTALINRPGRLVYLGSKLFVTVFAAAVARMWPGALSNAVDPGWVATRMGGPGHPTTSG
jgi:NAD(P)-dependent dehydrogenase (short-subunit alcohol dehydrogenase family)